MKMSFLVTANAIGGLETGLRIFFAVLVGCVIGVEREYKNRPAGMRTHMLVCLGAATVALLECLMREPVLALPGNAAVSFTMGRLSAQVISGIGFLGAGTIFMAQKKISGLTTAASLWNVACLGLLIGYGYYWMALVLCAIVMMVLLLFQRIIRVNAIKHVEVRFVDRAQTLPFINSFFEKHQITVLDVDFNIENFADKQPGERNLYTNIYTLHLPPTLHYSDIVNALSEYANIRTVRTRNT